MTRAPRRASTPLETASDWRRRHASECPRQQGLFLIGGRRVTLGDAFDENMDGSYSRCTGCGAVRDVRQTA